VTEEQKVEYIKVSKEELDTRCGEIAKFVENNKELFNTILHEPLTEAVMSIAIERTIMDTVVKGDVELALSIGFTSIFIFGFKYCQELQRLIIDDWKKECISEQG